MPRKLMNRGPSPADLEARKPKPATRLNEDAKKAEAEREARVEDERRQLLDILMGEAEGILPDLIPADQWYRAVTGRTASRNPNQSYPPRRGDARGIVDAFRGPSGRSRADTTDVERLADAVRNLSRSSGMTIAEAAEVAAAGQRLSRPSFVLPREPVNVQFLDTPAEPFTFRTIRMSPRERAADGSPAFHYDPARGIIVPDTDDGKTGA